MPYKNEVSIVQSIIDVIAFSVLAIVNVFYELVKLFVPPPSRKNFAEEVALITGGGSGLGRLLAIRLGKLGSKIVVWDVNEKGVEETVQMVKDLGGIAYGYKCDLCKREDVYKVAEITRKEVGDVTILINNAGVVSGHLLLETPDHLIQRTFDVNIIAHFWTAKAFLPKMIERDHGHIVTIASMAGFVGIHKLVDYCSSKHAAVGFDEALRIELEQQGVAGVKTTAICPYFLQATGMFGDVNSRFLPTLRSSDVADRVVEAIKREETLVMIPGTFKFGMVLKRIFPWTTVSMFLRNLVPDAHPSAHVEVTKKETEILTNGTKETRNGSGLTQRIPVKAN